jgi:hypothetical protein
MPTFCRHSHLLHNCPICSREQAVELRPLVSSSAPRSPLDRPSAPKAPSPRRAGASSRSSPSARGGGGLRVSKLARGADDGYRCRLVPGLKSSADAERLASELAFAATRLQRLEADPPGLYAELAASSGDIEERAWLAFLIAYLGPLDSDDPFSSIRAVRTEWRAAGTPELDGVALGPRAAHQPGRGPATLSAYRAWAARSGSQQAAFIGAAAWTAERRFERVFERMALPGFPRDARFDLLVTLGRTGVFELRAGVLRFGGENEVTVAAKRALGIGDPMMLERRAADLAAGCGLPLDALDLGLHNWGFGERATVGLGRGAGPDPELVAAARAGLGL